MVLNFTSRQLKERLEIQPLYKRIAEKKKQKQKIGDLIQIQDIIIEIDALGRLLGMVRKYEKGESLDGLAY